MIFKMNKGLLSVFLLLLLSGNEVLKAQNIEADSLISIARELESKAQYGEAVSYYDQAAQLLSRDNDTGQWIKTKIDYGEALVSQGEVRKGLEVFMDLHDNYSQKLSLENKSKILTNIGLVNRKLEQPVTARNYYLKALSIAEEIQDSVQIGRVHNNISYTYQETGDYDTAFDHQTKALDIFEALNSNYLLALGLNSTFLTFMELGMYEQATPYIRKSVDLREKLNNRSMLDVGFHNLAWNLELRGEIDSAIVYYQKSLELTRQIGNPYEITQTLDNIGYLYNRSGDYSNALAYYNEALQINYELERPVSTADNLIRIARIAIETEDYKNARSFYSEALNWLEGTSADELQISINLDLAHLEIMQGNYEAGRSNLKQAREILKDKEFNNLYIRLYSLTGELNRAEGKYWKSLSEFQKAYERASIGSISSMIQPIKNLAKAYNRVDSDSAYLLADKAFSLIDSTRINVAGVELKAGFFSDHAVFYNEVASWYIQDEKPEEAFDLIEAAKARVLMDELAVARESNYSQLDESTLIRKQQITKQIDRIHVQLASADSEQHKRELLNELKELEFRYHSFLNEMQVNSEVLKDFKYPDPITARQAMNLLDNKSVILEYAFVDNKMLCFLISENKVSARIINESSSEKPSVEFVEEIQRFREAIIEKKDITDIQQMGQDLYNLIVSDQLDLPNISNVVIIPAGVLTFLPFEALQKNDRYLVEQFNIKYLPSASIYSLIKKPHRETNYELLAVAGSGFEGQGNGAINPSRSQVSYASLPSTLLEVDSIAVNFENYKLLKNEEVTEATLKSLDLSDFRFLHFATHAEVDEEYPSQSGLLLSKKVDIETLFGEDGHLNSREISGLNLNADLVTLSACNTGMGKVITGEGLLGLQRSFIAAGASSVMVSLWSIFDRSTSVFMADFYRNLLEQEQEEYGMLNRTLNWFGWYEHPLFDYKSKALRVAKLNMIEHPYYNHPVYWAPFILVGK